jgi:hypothetical protein
MQQQVAVCEDMLRHFEKNGEQLLERNVMGDEM